MNKLTLFCAAHPVAGAGFAALLLHAAVLASFGQVPTRGERLLAYAYSEQFAAAEQSPVPVSQAAAMARAPQSRLARLAHRWLHLGTEPTAVRGPV
ncbi:MAG: hypothetical protein JWR07_3775 [Nevskia sp.]|nr:hypothetical protein [Nevskia sp.]